MITREKLLKAITVLYGWEAELITWHEMVRALKLEDRDIRDMSEGKKIAIGHYFHRKRNDGEAPPSGFVVSSVKAELLRQFVANQLFINSFTPVVDERAKAEFFVSDVPEKTWSNCTNGSWMYEFIPSNLLTKVDALCLNTIAHITPADISARDTAIDKFIDKHFDSITEKAAMNEAKTKVFGSGDVISGLIGSIELFREAVQHDKEYLDILSLCAGVNASEARKAGTSTPLYCSYCFHDIPERVNNEYLTAGMIKENISFEDILLNYNNIEIKYNPGEVGYIPQPGNYITRTIRRRNI